nr:response regulator [uncultured Sphingomonas sp.]
MSKKIMTVDDSPSIRMLLRVALSNLGFEVVEAEDGVMALEVLREDRPDLVITDISMPRLDGFGLIEAIRESNDRKSLPILILSTEAGTEKKERARETGANGWLVKPFEPDTLAAAIGRVLH